MAQDALDPGPDGSYPYMPRLPDGSIDPERMPRGTRLQRTPDGDVVLIDVTPSNTPDGRLDPTPPGWNQ